MAYLSGKIADVRVHELNVTEDEKVVALVWTADLPTEEGWYWVSIRYPNHGRHSHIIYIDANQTYSAPTDWDSENREHIETLNKQNGDALWLGPLLEPDPPKGL